MKRSILIVDDEPDLRNLLKMALEGAGYNVITAVNGDDCLEKLEDCKPDLILMDVMMPGTPVEKIVRQIETTKIAYLSIVKTSDLEREKLLRQDNVVDYIQKPFNIDELLARIDYLMSDSKLEIKKEMEKSRTILITIPNADYDAMMTNIVLQLNTEKICYITLNKTYESLKGFLNRKKISSVNMTFVDGITKTIINAQNRENCYFVSSPGSLDELVVTVSELLKQDFKYLIFDSVSDLLTYKGVDEVEQFVEYITDLLSENRCKGIFYAVSRYKYSKENRLSELLFHEKVTEEQESLVEEQIVSIDKEVDLRKKRMNKIMIVDDK